MEQPNPIALLQELTPDRIQVRLAEIEAEANALRVLLRFARAKDRATKSKKPAAQVEAKGGRA